MVERTFAWLGRLGRLARDYEQLTQTLARWHWLAIVTLLLSKLGFSSAKQALKYAALLPWIVEQAPLRLPCPLPRIDGSVFCLRGTSRAGFLQTV